MHIKKYYGTNFPEAMKKAKKDLGDNAIILNTKKVKKGGFLGFFKKEEIEILVAVEEGKDVLKSSEKPSLDKSSIDFKNYLPENKVSNKIAYDKVNNIKEDYNPPLKKDSIDEEINISAFKKEIDDLKGLINQINTKVDINVNNNDEIRNKFKEFYSFLKTKGMSDEIINETLSQVKDTNIDFNEFENIVYNYIINKFKSEGVYKFDKKVNIFVGTTGVGKTTTLAKLASNLLLKDNKKVAFLTLDTYRISAVNQLKVYADILNIPIEVAYDSDDIEYSLEKLENRDVIFVDTAGRSYKNKKQMQDLKTLLDSFDKLNSFEEKEVFLVISANYHEDDIKAIINEYSFLNDYNIIITKLDETNRIGIVFEILNISCKKVLYTTCGQNVPDDIEIFDVRKIANELLRR